MATRLRDDFKSLSGPEKAGLLMLAIVVITSRDPEHAPPGERRTWAERWQALRGIWGVAVLVVVVLGGIYGGFFTATEGAGFGAAGAFLFALGRRRLTWAILYQVLVESARTTAMLFTLLIAATGPMTLSEVGTSFSDILTAAPIVAGVALIAAVVLFFVEPMMGKPKG